MNNYEELWSGVLDTLRENISEQGFNTWFSETEIIDMDDNKLSVKVPTQFIADYLNSNYSELVSEICFNLFKNKYSKYSSFLKKIPRLKNNKLGYFIFSASTKNSR